MTKANMKKYAVIGIVSIIANGLFNRLAPRKVQKAVNG